MRQKLELPGFSHVLPASLVERVLQECGCVTKRERKLPAELVVWLLVGMGLFRSLSIQNCLDRVAEAIGAKRWGPDDIPCATSIAQARDRLGLEPIRLLFQRVADSISSRLSSATTWRGHPVFTLDGTCCLVPDTPANESWFGRPRCARGGHSGYPQLRLLLLVGVWTHVVANAVVGPYTTSEMELADQMLGKLKRGSIVLVDRAYYGFRWAALFVRHKSHFVVRMKSGAHVYRVKQGRWLGKGDRRCTLTRPKHLSRDPGRLPERVEARTVVCKRAGFRPVLILTDLVDPLVYPASELAALFRDRWEAELTYRELKIHLAGTRVTFRSKKPTRVLQEVFGLLIAYNCTRALMGLAAEWADVRPVQLSFAGSLNTIRMLVGTTSPDRLVVLVAHCRLPKRRVGRSYVRAVKLKFASHFPRKRKDRSVTGNPYVNRARQREARAVRA